MFFFFVIMRKFVRVGGIPSMCHVDVSDLLYGLSHALRKSPYVIYSRYGKESPSPYIVLSPQTKSPPTKSLSNMIKVESRRSKRKIMGDPVNLSDLVQLQLNMIKISFFPMAMTLTNERHLEFDEDQVANPALTLIYLHK